MSWRSVRRVLLYALAAIGALAILSFGLVRALQSVFYNTTKEAEFPAPEGDLSVVHEVTRGGFGTVYTTELYVENGAGDRRLIYRNRDSDFTPEIRWSGAEQLNLTVHCGRVDHMSSPAGWTLGKTGFDRFRVRFVYDEERCANPEGDE